MTALSSLNAEKCAVTEGVNELLKRANCPSWPGGVAAAIRKIAKHPLGRRRGGGSINSCRTWTTTLDASPYRARAARPPRTARWLRGISYRCSAPLLAKRGNLRASAIHSHLHRPHLQPESSPGPIWEVDQRHARHSSEAIQNATRGLPGCSKAE